MRFSVRTAGGYEQLLESCRSPFLTPDVAFRTTRYAPPCRIWRTAPMAAWQATHPKMAIARHPTRLPGAQTHFAAQCRSVQTKHLTRKHGLSVHVAMNLAQTQFGQPSSQEQKSLVRNTAWWKRRAYHVAMLASSRNFQPIPLLEMES